MQRTRLETFRQSYVVAVSIVVVGACSPVTCNRGHRLHGSTPRIEVESRNPVVTHSDTLLVVVGTVAGESLPVSGDAPPSLVGDTPLKKAPPTSPGKRSAGDAASGEGTAGVSKSLLVRSRIWSTRSFTCGSADTPLELS